MIRLRALLCILLCLLLPLVQAVAEDCFVIDVDALDTSRFSDGTYVADHLTAQTQGVRVEKTISDSSELAARIRLTIRQAETDTVIFDKNYGYVGGLFDSGDIYLPYVDNNLIPYRITLSVEDWTCVIPFMHLQPRLTDNGGCTEGVRLKDLNPSLSGGWLMGTMLDLDALRGQGSATVPVCASNLYVVGQATLSVSGEKLTVSLTFVPGVGVDVLSSAVYLVGDVAALSSADFAAQGFPAYGIGQAIPIGGLSTALLYVPLTLNYDPAGLDSFAYDAGSADIAAQKALWDRNLSQR
jgi:hypothetical protein